MRVNTKQAVRLFFTNPSLEQVFKEAIANSLDANATKIDIEIFIDSMEKQETLQIKITDNGEGFTDERYDKFCELLKVEEDTHKGVGRLVYLSYFNRITVSSYYGSHHRTFTFNDDFDKEKSDMQLLDIESKKNETTLIFEECSLKRLSSHSVITPDYLKRQILQEFFSRLYFNKKNDNEININFKINIPNKNRRHTIGSYETEISGKDIPEMNTIQINIDQIAMFANTSLDYSIIKTHSTDETFLMTAFCVDNRTQNLDDIVAIENLPQFGYKIIFILHSSYFDGKVDPARQHLTLKESELKNIKKIFRGYVAKIIEENIPSIKHKNTETKESLNKNYPHLVGYFNNNEIGIISRTKSIEDAQKLFMRDQKEILEAQTLDDERYDKALDVSSRTLAQYIIYREKIISKVEQYTKDNSEADLHDIILPKRSTLENNIDNIYNNNLWLLDNKYMTYNKAMSERTMTEVLDEIAKEANDVSDAGRPDIAIIFSNDPTNAEEKSIDVVIIELKKRGISLAKTEEVESQLQQRAIKLLKHYPNKIQRMWFYGIVEFTPEFKLSLRNDKYTPLYSKDSLYYKENEWYTDLEDDSKPYKVGTYILSIDAFINDAKAHNEIFLNVLKNGFRKNN